MRLVPLALIVAVGLLSACAPAQQTSAPPTNSSVTSHSPQPGYGGPEQANQEGGDGDWAIGGKKKDTPTAAGPDYPSGFKEWPLGEGIAYKFATADVDCSYYDSCVNVVVYSEYGCPSGLYVEANILDSSGTVVDYANDMLGSLGADQKARLILGAMSSAGSTYSLEEIACY
jgi:hypothetical protein